jgi:predicted metal-dependent hydrolase
MVYKDGQLGNLKDNVAGLNMLFGRQGFVTRILPKLPEFLGKRFHPCQHNTQALEQTWRDALFGAGGTLHARYRNREAA